MLDLQDIFNMIFWLSLIYNDFVICMDTNDCEYIKKELFLIAVSQ